MNLHRSRVARTAASVAALAVLIGPSAAGAWAQESPAPEPTPEATTTAADDAEAAADGKHKPTIPKDNVFSLGQSMQIRVNADGEQNAKMVNFRWSVSHLTIQGPPDGSKDGEYVVPVPEAGTLPRYLENFGFIHVENGYGQWDMNVENGWDTQRSVSIYPQDWTPNISLKTEFTLDGEPVKAQDIVGKDGLVTATYTLINNTTKPYDVVVKDLNGADVTTTAEGDSPMVAITKTLLPQRYIGLNTGAGIFGADGRGNNQVQWISLPFKPLAENSQASFGWAAYVTDAVILSLLTQVSPLYIPPHDPEAEAGEAATAEEASSPIPLDPAIAEIQAGLAQVASGLESISANKSPDVTCEVTNPANPGETTTDGLLCIQWKLNTVILGITSKPAVADLLTAFNAALADQAIMLPLMQSIDTALDTYITGDPTALAGVSVVCQGLTVYIGQCNGYKRTVADLLEDDALPGNPSDNQIETATEFQGDIQEDIRLLNASSSKLTTAVSVLSAQPIQDPTSVADILADAKQALLDAGGYDVQAGLDTVSSGVAQAKNIIAAYVSEKAAELQAAVQAGLISANDAVIHLRGEIGALKAAAAESPLIYGPLPPGTPEGTALAGAYEFRIDAADTNHPYTLPRILIGLIALIAGGLIIKYVGNRNNATPVV